MEEDPNPEVMTTDSTGSQRPEDGTQLPGQSATTEMATSCDGATDTLKTIKEEFQSQMMPPSKRTAADASNMDTNGRQFKKARVEEIVDQVVGADVMETDPVGHDQQVDLQHPTEITNGIKRAESQQDMENTKGHYNTTMSQPDAGSDERQVNKPKSSNKGISDSEAQQVAIKKEVDDTVEAGTNDNLNQINEQNSVQNSNSDNCIPEALVEETKEHPEIEMMDVDAANDHRQADVRQLESTSSEKPAEKTGEASNITDRRENIHNKDRTAKVSDIVIKQECDANIAEEALNSAPNQTQDQHGAPVHYSDNLTKEARVEEVFPEPPYSNRSNSKNNKVRADAGMQQLPHKRDNRRVLNKSNAANPPQSCGAGDEKNITEIDPFKIKGATKEKQFAAFREAADPNCPKNQVTRDIADINAGLKSFGKREFVGYQDKWHHRTLNFGLYNDQMIGVARMKELEKSGMGGLLADQMGFGKTAQIIALIVTTPAPMQQLGASSGTKGISHVNSNRQDDSNDGNDDDADEDEIDYDDDEDICPLSHCTLIIGPPRSSKQLLHECKRFIKPGKKVSITPYARKHENDGFDLNIYDRSDFIITTYSEVVAAYRVLMILLSEHELTTDDDWQKELTRAGVQLPVLYALKFWRVVLDESHQIRNMRTLRSKACHALQRVKSWCVSGTPYINSIWDIYSQLNFVGDEHAKTRVKFKARYCNTEEGDLISLNEKIGPLMIRRTSRDSRFGKPIIPEIEIERIVIKIPLSSGEKAFTKVIEEFFKDWAEEAKKAKNPVPGLALLRLLRLRQNTSSPFMLESFMVRTIPKARLKILKSRLAELEVEMRDVLPNLSREMDETQALSTDKDRPLVEPDSDPEVGEADMGELFDMAIAYKTNICGTCSRQCVERQVLECGHVFCKPCIFPNAPREAELTLWAQCPGCKNLCPVVQPYDQNNEGTDQNQSGIDFQSLPRGIEEEEKEEEEEDDDSGGYWTSVVEEHETGEKKTSKSKKSKKGQDKPPERRPGYDYRGSHPSLRKFETHWLQIADKTHNIPLIRRGKIGPCADLCDRILKKQPGDKIIAFTQFNQEAAMIGRLLQNLDIPFLYFNGKMTPRQTDEALKEMAENSKMKVMIVGLKCGGESLNCQFANHAILIGPYWNNAGEEQAIGRIARLGQKKKVFVYRLDASGTADDEVNLIQERKRDEAAELMGDVPAQYHAPTKD